MDERSVSTNAAQPAGEEGASSLVVELERTLRSEDGASPRGLADTVARVLARVMTDACAVHLLPVDPPDGGDGSWVWRSEAFTGVLNDGPSLRDLCGRVADHVASTRAPLCLPRSGPSGEERPCNLLAVPLCVGERLAGVLALYRFDSGRGPFAASERAQLEGLAPWLALVVLRAEATDERLAELKGRCLTLNARSEKLEAALMHAPAAFALLEGPEHVFVLSNRANERLVDGKDVIGRSVCEAFPGARGHDLVLALDRVYRDGTAFEVREAHLHALQMPSDFQEGYFNLWIHPLQHDGVTDRELAVYDVTELVEARNRAQRLAEDVRQAESRLRQLVDQAPDAIFIAGLHGHYLDINPSACALLGYERDELLHLRVADIVPSADLPRLEVVRRYLLASPENVHVGEWTLLRRDGRALSVEVSARILADGRWQAFVRDNTERKRAAVQRDEALKLREEFLTVAGHELRTPLTPLSLRLDALGRAASSEPNSPLAQKVLTTVAIGQRQVQKLSSLIADLLDVSLIESGRFTAEPSPMDFASVVREVLGRFQARAAASGTSLVARIPEVLEGHWDPMRVEQVVSNLVDNALKFGAGKPVEVELRQEEGQVRLRVRDHGAGIDAEVLPRLFKRWTRAVSERHYGGLGLGLFICRVAVEAMGGTLSVSSTPGEGAEFQVSLPLDRAS